MTPPAANMCDHCGCRSFPPIAELTGEHERILSLAWSLAEATRLDRQWPPGAARELLALLEVHAAKEESGLYPELVQLDALSDADRGLLEHEHRTILATLIASEFDRTDFYELANHIEVEETELFSTARFAFEEPEWAAMTAAHRSLDPAIESRTGSGHPI